MWQLSNKIIVDDDNYYWLTVEQFTYEYGYIYKVADYEIAPYNGFDNLTDAQIYLSNLTGDMANNNKKDINIK